MGLSSELISQFAKITKDKTEVKQGSTVYGTTVEYDGDIYVQLDGSDLLTPISTTADYKPGERVLVLIQNHTATVTGNISSPSARKESVTELEGELTDIGRQIDEFEVVIADKVDTLELVAIQAQVDELIADDVLIKGSLVANAADIESLKGENVYISEQLTAAEANIEELETKKLSSEQAELIFANIDFSNIGQAAIEEFFSKSGMIENLIVGEGTITGKLVGVTIDGDTVNAGTLKADRLVVLGEDGIYYKLNVNALGQTTVNGMTQEEQEELQNGLHGSNIIAKSITAEKVAVTDLVAFGATIGGFKITDDAIHSVVKTTPTNTTRGSYLDKEGQVAFGDSQRYLRYYKDANDVWHFELAADTIVFGTDGEDLNTVLGDIIKSVEDIGEMNAAAEAAQTAADNALIYANNATAIADASLLNLGTKQSDAVTANTAANTALSALEEAQEALANATTDEEIAAAEEAVELTTLTYNTAKAEYEAAAQAAIEAQAQYEQDLATAELAHKEADAKQEIANVLKGDIDALAERVSNMETTVEQNTELISLKAEKTDVDYIQSRVDVAESEITSTKATAEAAQVSAESNSKDVKSIRESMSSLQVQSDNVNIKVENIIQNGVDRVKTSMGYTFDDEGLNIDKEGEALSSTITHEGFYVDRTDINVLTANSDGVNALNIKVRQYLVVGDHLRIENYNNGTDDKRTAFFWLPGQ